LVEHELPKLGVAGSNPVSRSRNDAGSRSGAEGEGGGGTSVGTSIPGGGAEWVQEIVDLDRFVAVALKGMHDAAEASAYLEIRRGVRAIRQEISLLMKELDLPPTPAVGEDSPELVRASQGVRGLRSP
jgi:hypothetical protein